jgi:hypothetical protein
MAWSRDVFSSMIQSVGHNEDEESPEMTIVFAKGGTYVYEGVPEDVAQACANAPSVGQFINTQIKGFYPFRYV